MHRAVNKNCFATQWQYFATKVFIKLYNPMNLSLLFSKQVRLPLQQQIEAFELQILIKK